MGKEAATATDADLDERILSQVERGGRRFEALVLTRNRRVMASVGGDGRTLRLNECFIDAPEDALRALGRLFSTRSTSARSRARAVVRDYLTSVVVPTAPLPPRRGAPVPRPADRTFIDRLASEFERVNHEYFEAALPAVPIRVSGRMRRRLGHFCSDPLEIAISRVLCERGQAGEAEETLRHEMIHLWQWRVGSRVGHGSDFRQWARVLEITPRATRRVSWGGSGTFACGETRG